MLTISNEKQSVIDAKMHQAQDEQRRLTKERDNAVKEIEILNDEIEKLKDNNDAKKEAQAKIEETKTELKALQDRRNFFKKNP